MFAIVKLNLPLWPPTMFSPVVTVTVSFFWNGLSGSQLPPSLSESPSMCPVWAPVTDPTTVTFPIWFGGIPRKVICVPGRLYFVPGVG